MPSCACAWQIAPSHPSPLSLVLDGDADRVPQLCPPGPPRLRGPKHSTHALRDVPLRKFVSALLRWAVSSCSCRYRSTPFQSGRRCGDTHTNTPTCTHTQIYGGMHVRRHRSHHKGRVPGSRLTVTRRWGLRRAWTACTRDTGPNWMGTLCACACVRVYVRVQTSTLS